MGIRVKMIRNVVYLESLFVLVSPIALALTMPAIDASANSHTH